MYRSLNGEVVCVVPPLPWATINYCSRCMMALHAPGNLYSKSNVGAVNIRMYINFKLDK